MRHSASIRCILILMFFALTILPRIHAETFDSLKRNALRSESPEAWQQVIENAAGRKDTTDLGYAYVSYLQSLINMDPTGDFDKDVIPIQNFLLDTQQYSYYFVTCNLLIDRLFSKGEYGKAKDAATQMYMKAQQLGNTGGMAMALRVQGQIFYKLGLYDKAYKVLQEGLQICPPYTERLETFSTAQSICEWLFMTCRKLNLYDEMPVLSGLYGEMVSYWERQGWTDLTGHYKATACAFQAFAHFYAGRIGEAEKFVKQAETYVSPSLPARAYEHFYEARCLLRYKQEDYKGAIADIDILLETHRHFLPFYLNDLQTKAELLALEGQPRQSIELYRSYIKANDSIAKQEIARQLDELRVQYQVVQAQQESIRKTRYLELSAVIIALITAILCLYIRYTHKQNKQNRLLVARLEEYDKWEKERRFPSAPAPKEEKDGEVQEEEDPHMFMKRLDAFMTSECPFLSPSLDRKELAKAIGVNERTLANLIRQESRQSVVEYITLHRLEYARHQLSCKKSLTLKEIAIQSGFGTLRTFQRLFKDRYGMPPSQYREHIYGDK